MVLNWVNDRVVLGISVCDVQRSNYKYLGNIQHIEPTVGFRSITATSYYCLNAGTPEAVRMNVQERCQTDYFYRNYAG